MVARIGFYDCCGAQIFYGFNNRSFDARHPNTDQDLEQLETNMRACQVGGFGLGVLTLNSSQKPHYHEALTTLGWVCPDAQGCTGQHETQIFLYYRHFKDSEGDEVPITSLSPAQPTKTVEIKGAFQAVQPVEAVQPDPNAVIRQQELRRIAVRERLAVLQRARDAAWRAYTLRQPGQAGILYTVYFNARDALQQFQAENP